MKWNGAVLNSDSAHTNLPDMSGCSVMRELIIPDAVVASTDSVIGGESHRTLAARRDSAVARILALSRGGDSDS